MYDDGGPELGDPDDGCDSSSVPSVVSTVGETVMGERGVSARGGDLGSSEDRNTLAEDEGTRDQKTIYFNETTMEGSPLSGHGREMVVHAARTERKGISERALGAADHYGDPRVARTDTRDKDIRAVSTLVPRYEEDNLIFMEGTIENGVRLFMQLDGGSDLSCILMEHVRALGMESQMVPRDVSRQYRVRGIGQEAGKGQVVRYDVWLSVAVQGRSVVDWETVSMSPVGGTSDSLRVEGWFAVLDQMSVPVLVGGDLLYDHDVIPRVTSKQIVVQKKGREKERVVVSLLSLAAVVQEVGRIQDDTYRTPVWHDMARNMGAIGGGAQSQHLTGSSVILPRTMRAVKLRYPREVQPGELFAVEVERASLRAKDRMQMWVTGWDPSKGCDRMRL